MRTTTILALLALASPAVALDNFESKLADRQASLKDADLYGDLDNTVLAKGDGPAPKKAPARGAAKVGSPPEDEGILGFFTNLALGAKTEFSPLGGEKNSFKNLDYGSRLWSEEDRAKGTTNALPAVRPNMGYMRPPVGAQPMVQRPLRRIRTPFTLAAQDGSLFTVALASFLISFVAGAAITLVVRSRRAVPAAEESLLPSQ